MRTTHLKSAIRTAVALLASLVAWNGFASQWLDANSSAFKSVLEYGFARTLCSNPALNWWSSVGDVGQSFKLTQAVHGKMGSEVKVEVYGRKSDAGALRLYVVFPEFEMGKLKFILDFEKKGDAFLFLGDSVAFDNEQFDFVERAVSFKLPKDPRAVIKREFQPTPKQTARLRDWCRQAAIELYPNSASRTNHFFVAPFSGRYDDFEVTVYWVEERKIIRVSLISYPDKEGLDFKEMEDFEELLGKKDNQNPSPALLMNHKISWHVLDGFLITIDASEQKK